MRCEELERRLRVHEAKAEQLRIEFNSIMARVEELKTVIHILDGEPNKTNRSKP